MRRHRLWKFSPTRYRGRGLCRERFQYQMSKHSNRACGILSGKLILSPNDSTSNMGSVDFDFNRVARSLTTLSVVVETPTQVLATQQCPFRLLLSTKSKLQSSWATRVTFLVYHITLELVKLPALLHALVASSVPLPARSRAIVMQQILIAATEVTKPRIKDTARSMVRLP